MKKFIQKIKNIIEKYFTIIATGIICPIILGSIKTCGNELQTIANDKPKVDMYAELLTPIPVYEYDYNEITEKEDSNDVSQELDGNIGKTVVDSKCSSAEKVGVDSVWDAYAVGRVDRELVPLYVAKSELEYLPIIRLSLTNRNDFTINIKEITVEVLKYRSPDEFTVESPTGGADERSIQQWRCNISTEEQEYVAVYMGSGDEENDATGRYVSIAAGDSGEFNVVICADTPGLYSIKVNVNYTFKEKIKTKSTCEMKFVVW